jgi:hypothetical protein
MSNTLSREEKISKIMEFAGVAPRDRDHARKNYAPLSDAEIDSRYTRLSKAVDRIKDVIKGIRYD